MRRQYFLDQTTTPLFDALRKFEDWAPTPFFIPSHKMGEAVHPEFLSFLGENVFRLDISEVRWADDLHSPSAAIKEAQELAADAWGAERSFFLVNGTTGGVIAAVCAVCGEGDRIIVPRNAHTSTVYGLVISGAEPVYVMPEIDNERGLVCGFSPETLQRVFKEYPDAKAVVTVSPTFQGIVSDIASLSEIAHRQGAVFIADEAHGNHVYFNDRLPLGALELGADIVCQSIHKMSGSFTQSSILQIGQGGVGCIDIDKLRANLKMVQSTSPSYLLMASIDAARSYIATQGEALLDGALDALENARESLAGFEGIYTLGSEIKGQFGVFDYEPTRLVLSAKGLGLSGIDLFKLLREEYDIECDFADPNWCYCLAGIGTTAAHTEALTSALAEIAKEHRALKPPLVSDLSSPEARPLLPPVPPLRMTPREAWFAEKEAAPFEEARGRISAELVVPYPPGIPILCPGEIITSEVHEYLNEQRRKGVRLHCAAGDGLETLKVVK